MSAIASLKTRKGVDNKNINAFIDSQVNTITKPWSRYFLQYNPADEIEKLQILVLFKLEKREESKNELTI